MIAGVLALSLSTLKITPTILVFGLIVGSTYGILAVGLVLIYRVSKIINFAHGEIGAFGAAFLALAVNSWHVPYWVAFPGALAIAAGMGGLVEVGVIRRLRNAPRLMSVIATLGFAQFLAAMSLVVDSQSRTGSLFPEPPGLPAFHVGRLLVTPALTGMLFITPLVALAVALFLRFTRYGIAMRAASANPESARLDGISAARMSTLAWVIAGAVAGITAILILPTQTYSGDSFGPSLLVSALTAAVLARMSNLVVAYVAGLGVGLVEQVLLFNNPSGGEVQAILFGIILVSLLFLQPKGGRGDEKGSAWASLLGWRPLPEAYRRVLLIRHGSKIVTLTFLAVAAAVPLVASSGDTGAVTSIFALGIVGLSIGVVTGLAGQLSLGQFAIAAIGATVAIRVAHDTGNYLLGIVAGGAAGALASVIVGVPALRIRGLMLAVTTLALALMSESWLLQQPWMLGDGVNPGHPLVGPYVLDRAKTYYYLGLVALAASLWLSHHVRRGGIGRILVALRDNEDAARAFTVGATSRKLQGFIVAGVLAGVGGSVYAFGISRVSFDTFHTATSINLVATAVIGGLGMLGGPILGAFYIFGVPTFLRLDSAGLAAQAAGWLLLILYLPGGLSQLVRPVRDRGARLLARASGITDADEEEAESTTTSLTLAPREQWIEVAGVDGGAAPTGELLVATDLRKRYGGVAAVDGVTLHVASGQTVGLIGPNGAGKTTFFEILSGFTKPDGGTVTYNGIVVNGNGLLGAAGPRRAVSPERRGRLGLVRSFQDAALFPTMTVEEVVMLSMERRQPTTLFASVAGSRELEGPKRAQARDLVNMMGLDSHRLKPISALSTGTRRVTELCCMIALEPRLLLLDEPSSGIAQRETEALGQLLVRVREHLHATLVIIEHDIPMIMSLADRVVAMEAGRIIADGTPAQVRANDRVIESYLGGDVTAIERSDVKPRKKAPRKVAVVPV